MTQQQEGTILRTSRILIINDRFDDDTNEIEWLVGPLWANGFHVEKVIDNPFNLSELLSKQDSFHMIIFSFPIAREYVQINLIL